MWTYLSVVFLAVVLLDLQNVAWAIVLTIIFILLFYGVVFNQMFAAERVYNRMRAWFMKIIYGNPFCTGWFLLYILNGKSIIVFYLLIVLMAMWSILQEIYYSTIWM